MLIVSIQNNRKIDANLYLFCPCRVCLEKRGNMKERRIDVAFWPAEQEDGLALFRTLQRKLEEQDFD